MTEIGAREQGAGRVASCVMGAGEAPTAVLRRTARAPEAAQQETAREQE